MTRGRSKFKKSNGLQGQAEEAFQDSQQLLPKAFASLREAVLVMDPETTRILDCNPAAVEIFGYDREEMTGQTAALLYPGEAGWEEFRKELRGAMEEKGFLDLPESVMKRKNGEAFTTMHSVTPLEDAQGRRVGWVSVIRDITPRKRAEEALRESEERLQLAQGAANAGVWDWNIVTGKLKWSQEFYSTYGLPGNIDPSYENWLRTIHPEDRERVDEAIAQAIKTQREIDVEFRAILPDGRVRWLNAKGQTYYDEASRPVRMIGITQDITRRKQTENALRRSEERFRKIFEGGPLGMAIVGPDYRLVRVNAMLCQMLGYTEQELTNLTFPQITHPEDIDRDVQEVQRLLSAEIPFFNIEKRYLKKNGEILWGNLTASIVRGERGRPLYFMGMVQDITERKRIEKDLKTAHEELEKKVQERTYDLIKRLKELNCLYTVSSLLNKEEGSIGEVLERVIHWIPSGWQFSTITCARIVIRGQEFETENCRETIWKQSSDIFSQGKPVGTLEVCYLEEKPERDEGPFLKEERTLINALTDQVGEFLGRRQVQEALWEEEKKVRLIAESVTEVIFAYDQNRRLIFVNPAVEKLTGYTAEELQGKSFINWCHPEDASRMLKIWEEGFEGNVFPNPEFRIITKDGQIKWCQSSWTPLTDESGQRVGTVVIDRDITQRKISEQEQLRLVTAFEQTVEGIAILDVDHHILYGNPSFQKLHGLSGKEGPERKYEDLINVDPRGKDPQGQWGETLGRGEVWNGHLVLKQAEENICELEVRISPIKDASGVPTHYVTVERDVTREIKLEERTRQWQKMEALGTLAGGVAHDLNNILMPIMINTDLALLDVQEGIDPSPHHLKLVKEAAMRGQELVKQIITFSRPKEQARTPVEIVSLVKEALNFLRSTIPKTIEIRGHIEAGESWVLADPTQIHQVLMNLCSNAAHAMREKGGLLEIALAGLHVEEKMAAQYPGLKPGPYLRLTVRDTGHGMDHRVRERAFDPFFTTKKPGEGTGMGLAVVHGIVKNHGGVITLESEVGNGTTATIFLPMIQGKKEKEIVSPELVLKGKERILLIDDEEIQVRSIQNMLERLGYRVISKTDPRQALEIFQARPQIFDLVITDQTMPHMTGDKLARELLSLRPDVPIILCTGFSEIINEEEARNLGVRDFAMKPLAMRDLAERIRRVLRR